MILLVPNSLLFTSEEASKHPTNQIQYWTRIATNRQLVCESQFKCFIIEITATCHSLMGCTGT